MFEPETILKDVFNSLVNNRDSHQVGEPCYKRLAQVNTSAVAQIYGSDGANLAIFPHIGKIELPFFSMGNINSSHLFGLDEMIIFAFYVHNKTAIAAPQILSQYRLAQYCYGEVRFGG